MLNEDNSKGIGSFAGLFNAAMIYWEPISPDMIGVVRGHLSVTNDYLS